jgi:serine/threonine protein kinase
MDINYSDIGGYTVISVLGQGASGKVYQVQKDGKLYAIKSVKLCTLLDQVHKANIVSELNISRSLHHKNVILFHDAFKTDIDLCLLFEYCNFHDLTRYINSNSISENEAIDILKQICEGYVYLYNNKIMHRDMKPDNILLHKENDKIIVKIADFGVSKSMSSSIIMTEQKTKSFNGTPYFMSPQLLNGLDYNYQCDIYSIGVIYYYMLFKEYPFKESNPIALSKLVKEGNLYFNTANKKISKQSIGFIVQCLQYDANKRIHTRNLLSHEIFREPYDRDPADYYYNEEIHININQSST